MTAGVADRDMGTGVDTGLGIVQAGTDVLTVRDRVIGMVIAVTAIIATAIAAIMTDGGIRLLHLVQEQL